ncbi:hypothetical protein FHX82_004599 [Amycolatopsis bartoniae]|uniref:Uncharacterized protein n=1 Tax=Amycolatopsis bartoniae TaxID=941986 RepID=A0A8H9J3D9_9PSEU|nr:hypothetical protein [Amycolatopsis bartoniae]GHF81950.1 hypothetical protein GCM10017566_65050 [Amycolatopsis bartoniae]
MAADYLWVTGERVLRGHDRRGVTGSEGAADTGSRARRDVTDMTRQGQTGRGRPRG